MTWDKSKNTYTDEELKEILAQHKLWLDTNRKKGKRADLSSVVLVGVDLTKAVLRRADLSKATLTGATLTGANLIGANLIGADLSEVDLRRAVLRSANLTEANLMDANLRGADLRKANCEDANFINATVNDTKTEKTNLLGAIFLNLAQQELFLNHNIQEAQNALANSLTNADNRIQECNKTAKLIGRVALELMGLVLFIILLYWYHYEKIIPIFDKLNAWALPVLSFPILIVLTITITLFRHQKKLLDEVRHYSADKRQIELYSGLLIASQYSAKSLNDPQKSAEYVKETFDKIRDRILSEQPHANTAGSAVEQEEYSSSLEPLIKVISDMIAKSEVKK